MPALTPRSTIPTTDALPNPKVLAADSDTRAIGFGFYAADQVKLNQYFDIVGGARWDYFDNDFDTTTIIPRAITLAIGR